MRPAKAIRPFDRDRGRRAILALLRGEWDEPMMVLCEIFDVEEVGLSPLSKLADVRAHEEAAQTWNRSVYQPPARPGRWFLGDSIPPRPRGTLVEVFEEEARGLPLRFAPVVDDAFLRRFNREHTRCAACGSSYSVAGHHLIPRSVLRLDAGWNLLPLCSMCHLNSSPTGFHYLGPRRWFWLNRTRLSRYDRRRVMVALFVIKPWIIRGGREGPTIVTR